MISFFMDFITHEMLGRIDNSHLAQADISPKLVYLYKKGSINKMHEIK